MRRRLALGAACAVLLAGCSGVAESERTVTVLAAASLTESFGALEKRFESEHAGVDVKISYAGSSTLAQQINNGAPADVFAAADEHNMAKVVDAGSVAGRQHVFATNRLSIVTGKGNPKNIDGLADLARRDLTVVVCAPEVPCGQATAKVQHSSGVRLRPASEERDVKSVLNKVRAGEADAGLVYLTDVRAAGESVRGVDFPASKRAINNYPITVLRDPPEPELAERFVDLVRGAAGKRALARAGFGVP